MADIKLKDRNDNEIAYTGVSKLKVPAADGGEDVVFQLPPVMQEKAVTITANGTTSIVPDEGKDGLSKVDVTVNVAATPTQEKTIPLSMADGDQVVTPDEGKVLTKVTVQKPPTLTPENVKKDVNIGGVVGALESGGGGGSIHILTDDVTSKYTLDPAENQPTPVGGFNFSTLTADTLNRAKIIFIGAYNARIFDTDSGVQINNLCYWLVLSNEKMGTRPGVEYSMLSMAGMGLKEKADGLAPGRGINGIGYGVKDLNNRTHPILKYQAKSGGYDDPEGGEPTAASYIVVEYRDSGKTRCIAGFKNRAKYKAFVVTDFLPPEAAT